MRGCERVAARNTTRHFGTRALRDAAHSGRPRPFYGLGAVPRAPASRLSSTDGRWALVSTSVTALIAGTITWIAAGAATPTNFDTGTLASHAVHAFPAAFGCRPRRGIRLAVVLPLGGPLGRFGKFPHRRSTLAFRRADSAEIPAAPANDVRDATLERGDSLPTCWSRTARRPRTRSLPSEPTRTLRSAQHPRRTEFRTHLRAAAAAEAGRRNHLHAAQSGGGRHDTAQAEAGAGRLLSIGFSPSVEHDVTVSRAPDGGFTAQDQFKKLEAHYHRAGARIDSSLYLAAMQAGIPARVVVQMIHMFSYEVDFQRDIRPGDSFEVYYNYYYTPDGSRPRKARLPMPRCTSPAARSSSTVISRGRGHGRFLRCERPEREEHADEDAGRRRAHLVRLRHALPSGARLHAACTRASISRCPWAHPSWRRAPEQSRRSDGRTVSGISSCSITATAMPRRTAICRVSPPAYPGLACPAGTGDCV